jgi:hypothetical protein
MFIRSRCGRPAPNHIYDICQYLQQQRLINDGEGAKKDNLPSATLCIAQSGALRCVCWSAAVQMPYRRLSAVHSPYKRCLGTRWSDGEKKRREDGVDKLRSTMALEYPECGS